MASCGREPQWDVGSQRGTKASVRVVGVSPKKNGGRLLHSRDVLVPGQHRDVARIGGPFGVRGWGLIGQECQRLKLRDFEWLATANIRAGKLVVTADHVGLRFGEAGAVTLVGVARQLRTLAADDPSDFVFGGHAALGASECVAALLGRLVEKFPFFHGLRTSPQGRI
jgi:hypothetical protein